MLRFFPISINGWIDVMAYRVTQILTGHGCFSTYLYRIGKMDSPQCEHCDDVNAEDSAEHTLQDCAAWTRERGALKVEIGDAISMRG